MLCSCSTDQRAPLGTPTPISGPPRRGSKKNPPLFSPSHLPATPIADDKLFFRVTCLRAVWRWGGGVSISKEGAVRRVGAGAETIIRFVPQNANNRIRTTENFILGGPAGPGARSQPARFPPGRRRGRGCPTPGFASREPLEAINIEFNVNTHSNACLNFSFRS